MITFGIYYFTSFKSLNLGLIGGILEALLRDGIMIASLIAISVIIAFSVYEIFRRSKVISFLWVLSDVMFMDTIL